MSSSSSYQNPKPPNSLYPQIIMSNPDSDYLFRSNPSSKSPSLYPTIEIDDLAAPAQNLFPYETSSNLNPPPTFESSEDVLVRIPGAIVHLIDKRKSIELACGDLIIVRLWQNDNVVAVLARVGDEIQWPLARDEAAVKLDDSHYFFTLRVSSENETDTADEFQSDNLLNYGLTIASKGQGDLLKELDMVLEQYSAFSVKEVEGETAGRVLEVSAAEMGKGGEKKELVKQLSAAYWTTLAPNVEDYSGSVAKLIAAGSGQVIRGILWCGDVTVDGLRWGNEVLKKRVGSGSCSDISPQALRRMKRVKKLTKMSENVATGILSGVVKVSGFVTSSIVNRGVGKKFFNLLPGEIVLASLDGFNKVFDAVEVAGRNVMSTTSVVTTGLVSQRYGEQAGEVTHDGMSAAGHAIGTAWAVYKIRKALNPKSVIKPTTLMKAAAAEAKANSAKSKSKDMKAA